LILEETGMVGPPARQIVWLAALYLDPGGQYAVGLERISRHSGFFLFYLFSLYLVSDCRIFKKIKKTQITFESPEIEDVSEDDFPR